MAQRKERDKGKEAFWRDTLRQQSRSGLTIRAYCRKHRLGESLFYFWRRELARRDSVRQQRPFVAVRVRKENEGSGTKSTGHRGDTEEQSADGRLEIELAGGRRVLVSGPVDRQALREVLTVLEGISSC